MENISNFKNIHKGEDTRVERIYWAMMGALTEDEQENWRRTLIDEFNINDGDGGNSDGDGDDDGGDDDGDGE